jgi:thioredoxin reductase (NADPH)
MADFELSPEQLAAAFPKLNDAQVAALDAIGTRRHLPDRAYLFHTGDTDLSLFVIVAGEVEIFDVHSGVENLVVLSVARDFVGDVSTLMGGAAVISARCRGAAELIEVPAHSLRKAMAEMTLVSEPIVRAFMIRRKRLVAGVHGFIGLQVVGEADSHEAFHLHDFLTKNCIPHRFADANLAGDGLDLCQRLGLGPDQLPAVVADDGTRVLYRPTLLELARLAGTRKPLRQTCGGGSADKPVDLAIVGSGPAGWRRRSMQPAKGLRPRCSNVSPRAGRRVRVR